MAYGSPANTDAGQNIDKHMESTLGCVMYHNKNNYQQHIDSNQDFVSVVKHVFGQK